MEASNELVTRDGYVISAAQREIDLIAEKQKATRLSTAQKLKALEESWEDAILIAKVEFQKQLTKDVLEMVRRDVASGELKLMNREEESKAIVDADKWAKQQVLLEIKTRLAQEKITLSIQITGSQVNVCFGTQQFASRCYGAAQKGEEIVRALAGIVGADCP